MNKMKLLIVEDDDLMQNMLRDAIKNLGTIYEIVDDGFSAWKRFEEEAFDLVVADYKLPVMDGLELLRKIKETSPDTLVIMMTAYGTVENAVEAMKQGAYDFISKPFLSEELVHIIKKCEELIGLKRENVYLKESFEKRSSLGNIIGKSKRMQEIYHLIEIVAPSQSTILIHGESGTGKELIAEAVHRLSPRKDNHLIKVSCAALPENLMESELFGHEKGAFTDAHKQKIGRFELANHGTIFLDDIDDMNLNVQVKLLRVLQEREITRVGGADVIPIDVRVIAATKKDLNIEIDKGTFRDDLFYRLNVVPVQLPPLRERSEDIPLLIDHFRRQFENRCKRRVPFSQDVYEYMMNYTWPGNIRELENLVERLTTVCTRDEVQVEDLPESFHQSKNWSPETLKRVAVRAEKEHIVRVLNHTQGHKKEAAQILGITPKTLWMKIKEYGLE